MYKDIENNFLRKYGTFFLVIGVVTAVLFVTSLHNFLLFHTLSEIFSIAVAFAVFLVAWNCRKIASDNYLLFIGLSCIFISVFDLLHTLSYKGIGVIDDHHADIPTQLWIAARYLQSAVFLVAPFYLRRKLHTGRYLTVLMLVSAGLLMSIFYWRIFPECFIEGRGLTPFKKVSEYVISVLYFLGIVFLWRKKDMLARGCFYPVVAALVLFILSELCFTVYVSAYGQANLLGHFFKVSGFALIYVALVQNYITDPFSTMFRDLKQREVIQGKALSAARQRTNEVTALLAASRSILENDQFEQVALDIVKGCRKLTNALSSHLSVYENCSDENIKCSVSKGMNIFAGSNHLINYLHTRYGQLSEITRPFYDNNVSADTGITDVRNLIFAPVIVENIYIGFIVLFNKEGDFNNNDLRMLKAFSESTAVAFKSFRSASMLKESRERFAMFMDNFPGCAYIKDKAGEYIYANKYFEENILSKDASGRMYIPNLTDELKHKISDEDRDVLEGKPFVETVNTFTDKNDKTRVYLSRKFPLVDRSGETLIAGVTFDITEKQRYEQDLRKEQQKLESILGTIIHGVTIIDQDYNIRYVNPAMEKIFGPVGDKKCYDYICESSGPCSWCKFGDILEGKSVKWEYRDMKTGRIFDSVEVPYADTINGDMCKLKMIWDVTDMKEASEKIRNLSLFPSQNPNPVLRISGDGILLYANEPSKLIMDHYGLEVNKKISDELFVFIRRALDKGSTIDQVIEINGHFSLLSIAPLVNDNYVNIYARDITDYKNAEAELIRAKNELEYRVRQRTKQLEKTVGLMEKQVEERLAAEAKLLANQKRLRLLTQKLILTEERERRKFAVQLHDSVGQLLAYSKRELGVLADTISDDQKAKVQKVWDIIRESIDLTRKVTFDLSSPTLYTLGLKTAVEEVAEQVSKEYDRSCTLRSCNLPVNISEDVEVFLYRSIRELLLNSAKHADAANIYIDMATDSDMIEVIVTDDGIGFDTDKLNSHNESVKTYGLFSVRENLDNLGGQLNVRSEPGKGTEVYLRVPY
jgi:signal transduction histidine kinase/PAS domain-containing protein